MNRILLTVLIFLISTTSLIAQNKTQHIFGTITDSNGNAVSDVIVFLEGTNATAFSDETGKYNIEAKPGKYRLITSSLEYDQKVIPITITQGEKRRLNINLGKKNTTLEEVVVVGKSSIQQLKEGAFAVNVIDLKTYANSTADINQVLKRTTGITIREDGGVGSDFTFKINGLDAKVFIDGVPMENYGSSMTINNIPVNMVERVEVYKGVVPAYLGTDALGGAVDIITKRKNRKFLDVSYGYGSFNTHQASVVGSFKDAKSGFTVKTSGFFNYSDNDYNMYSVDKYNIILEKAENGKYVRMDKAKRFHDAYRSTMGQVEVGFEDRKWADRLLFGLTYSENKKENQLGATINSVKGGEWSTNSFVMPSLQYRKDSLFLDNLYLDTYLSYSKSTTHVRDTATYVYDWTGNWASSGTPLKKIHRKYEYNNYMGKINLNYNFNAERTQSLSFTYNLNSNSQKTFDIIKDEKLGLPAQLTRHIANLAWQGLWLNNKLVSTLSAKYYGMKAKQDIDERQFNNDGSVKSGAIKTYKKYFDYKSASLALRYTIIGDMGIKASIERAYNLPGMTPLFGDGQNYLSNFDLKPERSDNYNLGFFYNTFIHKDHFINFELSGFYRNARDFINTRMVDGGNQISGKSYQFYNSPGVKLYGIEADVKYGYKDILNVAINGTYDKAINNWKYTDDSKSQVSLVYKKQLPNRPWIYGNFDLSVGKRDLLGKNSRIELKYMYQYIHWFYLSWENLGAKRSKNYVPTQTIHSAILSYSWDKDRYTVSAEARNFTDERCYDNFRLQKPGRAFYIKFRLSLM